MRAMRRAEGRAERMDAHPTYATRDIWQASWLLAMGCTLRQTRVDGRVSTWIFDNPDGKAFRLGIEFRTEGIAVCPVLELRGAYRFAARAADNARKGLTTNDNDNR